jgi:hypothetical protein
VQLNGSSSYIESTIDVSETAFTAAFWFKTSNANAGLFSVKAGNLGASGHDRHLYLTGGNMGVRIYDAEVRVTTGRNYANNAWHHVAYVYGGAVGGQKVYVDGAEVLSGVKVSSDFTWQERVCFGYSNDAATPHLPGFIDEPAVWNVALSAAEIANLAAGDVRPALGFNVSVADANGCAGQRSYRLTINCPAITVNPTSLANGTVGTAYSQTVSAAGGSGAMTYAVTAGALPAWATLSDTTGAITGNPNSTTTNAFQGRMCSIYI